LNHRQNIYGTSVTQLGCSTAVPHWTQTKVFHAKEVRAPAPMHETLPKPTVLPFGDHPKLTGNGVIAFPDGFMLNALEWFSQLQFIQDWEFEVHPAGSWSLLLQELHNQKGFAVSNGSFQTGTSAAACILEGQTPNFRICGKCFTLGHDDNHSSFWSKLTGIYSLLLLLYFACLPHSVEKPKFQLACNGKSMLYQLCWNTTITAPNEPHYNLLSGTCFLLANCKYLITLVHIYGHQDMGFPTVLSQEAYLNIKADVMAKA